MVKFLLWFCFFAFSNGLKDHVVQVASDGKMVLDKYLDFEEAADFEDKPGTVTTQSASVLQTTLEWCQEGVLKKNVCCHSDCDRCARGCKKNGIEDKCCYAKIKSGRKCKDWKDMECSLRGLPSKPPPEPTTPEPTTPEPTTPEPTTPEPTTPEPTTPEPTPAPGVSDMEWQLFEAIAAHRKEGYTCPGGERFAANPNKFAFNCYLWSLSRNHSEDMAKQDRTWYNENGDDDYWVAMFSVDSSVTNAEEIFQQLSKPHDGYYCREMMTKGVRIFGLGSGANSKKNYWNVYYLTGGWTRYVPDWGEECFAGRAHP